LNEKIRRNFTLKRLYRMEQHNEKQQQQQQQGNEIKYKASF
jgi:hypothetical protein